MKHQIRGFSGVFILLGCILITGLLFVTNYGCDRETHGECVVTCSCPGCTPSGYTVTGADTEEECIADWQKNDGSSDGCDCDCSWKFTPDK